MLLESSLNENEFNLTWNLIKKSWISELEIEEFCLSFEKFHIKKNKNWFVGAS